MKSIFLLCEYGIPINVIINLDNEKINLEDINNNINCLDKYIGPYSEQKLKIKKYLKKINENEKEYSVYELIKYGLSKNIVDKLYTKRIEIEDINETIKDNYHIGEVTYNKIIKAYDKFIKDKNVNFGLTDIKMIKIIEKEFIHQKFSLEELIQFMESEGFTTENLDQIIEELLKQKKLKKEQDRYVIPYSVCELEKYGLSKVIIDSTLIAKNISIDEIDETIKDKYHITPAKLKKILDAYDLMANDLNIKKDLNKDTITNIVRSNVKNKVITKEEIIEILNKKRYKLASFEELFIELLNDNEIIYENNGYRVAYPKLMEELPKVIKDKKHYDMVIKKLSGYTLEQIGNEYNVTRERIRQIITKELKKVNHVKEEEYREYMENYDFRADLFSKLFNLNECVYYYLREKFSHGEAKPSELLDDNRLSSEQIEILRKEYNIIRYNDENIVADTIPILLAYLKKEDRRVEYEDLIINYNKIISEYNLDLDILTQKDFRNIDSRLTRTNYILDTIGKNYRYYNCNDIEEDDIKELKHIFKFFYIIFFNIIIGIITVMILKKMI